MTWAVKCANSAREVSGFELARAGLVREVNLRSLKCSVAGWLGPSEPGEALKLGTSSSERLARGRAGPELDPQIWLGQGLLRVGLGREGKSWIDWVREDKCARNLPRIELKT